MAGSGFIYNTRRKGQALAARILPNEVMAGLYTKILCGYYPDLKKPKTFNEKVQWLKLYYYPEDTLAVNMTDKYRVRKVLEEKGLGNLLPELLYVTEDPKDIPWEKLPDKFVIKCNHGCAYNIICENKNEINIQEASKKLKKWMKEDFGLFNIEPHYSKIERKIIVEEYLGAALIDYKLFCFNGEPKFLYVSKDLAHDSTAQMSYFDMNWNKIPLIRDDYAELEDARKPECFNLIVDYARRLSEPFPFVRVDFYVINGKPVFSEMTFDPSAGMMPVNPRHYDKDWGDLLNINDLVKNK